MTLTKLQTYGERGGLVRLWRQSGARKAYVVQWSEHGARKQLSFPLTPAGKQEAEAFAKAFAAEATRTLAVRTTRALWDAYTADQFPMLRPNSQRLYREAWRHWEGWFGPLRDPGTLTLDECGAFRRALEAKGHGVNTVRGTIRVVRTVYNWAEPRDFVAKNRWHGYRFKVLKGTEPAARAEYRADEFVRLWQQLDPVKPTQWRAWVVLGLLGIYGNRQHAVLALRWDWVAADAITIPPEADKTGKGAVLPMLPLARRILDVAQGWRERTGYDGPYVLFSGSRKSKRPTYAIQSFWKALTEAEQRAGVVHLPGRAGHGFRRMLVGDLADATGDVGFALQAIGDSLAMAKHYRVRRDDRIRDALAARLGRLMADPAYECATESATNSEISHPNAS